MKKEARVLIADNDPFVRNWIALLLARDWRTRVVGEVDSPAAMQSWLDANADQNVNLVLLNDHLLSHENKKGDWPADWSARKDAPAVLLLGNTLSTAVLQRVPFPQFCGYLLKSEICYALAWAIACADTQRWAITPGLEAAIRHRVPQAQLTILDGRRQIVRLTESEKEYARLAIIFSMERPDVSDEKNVSIGWGYSKISELYEKLGLDELLSGEADPAERFGAQFTQIPHFQHILKQAGRVHKSKKNRSLETLAFHILCMPEIQVVG
jgi:DNA-binding NarL/FixJ family response regulator